MTEICSTAKSGAVLSLLLAGLLACAVEASTDIGGATAGDACAQHSDCEAGLGCRAGSCVGVPPSLPDGRRRGESCAAAAPCGEGLFCGGQSVCTTWPGSNLGQPCGLTADCLNDLVCHGGRRQCVDENDPNPGTVGAAARAGVKALDESCGTLTDCRLPLICPLEALAQATCSRLPFFGGVDCSRSDSEAGAFRVYYELDPVPSATTGGVEFYRLPFPDDTRQTATGISMAGHPAPTDVLGIDVRSSYLSPIEGATPGHANREKGFALNQPVFFRLTDMPQPESLCLSPPSEYPADIKVPNPASTAEIPLDDIPATFCTAGSGAAPSAFIVNVDRDSPAFGAMVPVELDLGSQRNAYICQNWVGLQPLAGHPLAPGTTYAAILTTGLRDVRDQAPIADRDFARVLRGSADLSPQVQQATAPLRSWLESTTVYSADAIAAAAVFTTADPDLAVRLRAVVRAQTLAFNDDAIVCADATPAPCHGLAAVTPTRQCPPNANNAFREVHGTYTAPAFQSGGRPFLSGDASVGTMRLASDGAPVIQANETMCYALTLPSGSVPTGGWPVVIYGHGTGGNFRSFVGQGYAETFAQAGFATIGYDGVMHGPRQGPSLQPSGWAPLLWKVADPGRLFFNLLRPVAARDNIHQGSADLFSLVHLLQSDVPTVAGAGVVRFDSDNIVYIGHSQGTVVAPAFLSTETDLAGAVFSGAGAELALSILHKQSPFPLRDTAGAVFGDRNLGRVHPMMGVLSMLFSSTDAITYADRLVGPHAFLQFSGIGDTFTPDQTQLALLQASGVGDHVLTSDVTLRGNYGSPGVTAGVFRASADGPYDGHFLMGQHAESAALLRSFLVSVRNDNPTLSR